MSLVVFLADWSLKSSIIIALALVFHAAMRRRSAASKSLVWRTALAAVIILPALMVVATKSSAPAVMEPIQAPIRVAIQPLSSPTETAVVTYTSAMASFPEPPKPAPFNAKDLVLAIYGIGVAAFLLRWAVAFVKIRRVISRATEWKEKQGAHPVLIAQGDELRVPVTLGLFKPVILLPREAEGWPESRVRSAIPHESAHITRRDWLLQTVATWIRAFQWMNPAAWLLASEVYATSESAADDAVLTAGMSPASYANELLNVAASAQSNLVAATAMARRAGVAGRIRRIVAKEIDRRAPSRLFTFGFAAAFAVGGMACAAGSLAAESHDLSGVPATEAMRLKTGALVKLVFVSDASKDANSGWQPNGATALANQTKPFANLDKTDIPAANGRRNLYLNFEIQKVPQTSGYGDNPVYRIHGNTGAHYQGGVGFTDGTSAFNRDLWSIPAGLRTVDVDCAIASAAYQTYAREAVGGPKLHAKIGLRENGTRIEPDPIHPERSRHMPSYMSNRVTVTVQAPGNLQNRDLRVVVYDKSGNMHTAITGLLDVGHGGWTCDFDQMSIGDVARVELQDREFERFSLKGVKLNPN